MNKDEFNDFLNSEKANINKNLHEEVLNNILALLNPSPYFVFMKLVAVHLVIGSLSLSICHQFDVNPFGTQLSLSDYFMSNYGHNVCMVFCGFFYLSTTYLVALNILSVDERRVFIRNIYVHTVILSLTSVSVFWFLGNVFLLAVLYWMLGSVCSAVLTRIINNAAIRTIAA